MRIRTTTEEFVAFNDGFRTALAAVIHILEKRQTPWYQKPGVNLTIAILKSSLDKSYDKAGQNHLRGEAIPLKFKGETLV